jgi:arsenical pump membrane protein
MGAFAALAHEAKPMSAQAIIWIVAASATAGVIIRPFDWPEAVWAVTGAALLVLSGLLSPGDALAGVASGADVYLFLAGMMLLAEIGRAGILPGHARTWTAGDHGLRRRRTL